MGQAVICALALLFVLTSFEAQSQGLVVSIYKQMKDAETGFVYAIPSEMSSGQGHSNPCTYRSFMIGLPVSFKVIAAIPGEQRDRLMDSQFVMTIIDSAARSFEKICPEARFYSMDGAPSDWNTNKLQVFVLFMKDGQLIPYSERNDNSFDEQYAVKALLVPSKGSGGRPTRWVSEPDRPNVQNRVVEDEPERRRKVKEQESQVRFEAEQRERQSNRRPATQLASGEWLVDLGVDGQSDGQTWAKLQTKNPGDACDVPKDPNLRAMVVITQEKILSLGAGTIRQIITGAATRMWRFCPQTRICRTYQPVTFYNPLRPPPPSPTVTNCTFNGNPDVRVVLVPPAYRLDDGDQYERDPQPVFASAIVSPGNTVTQYSDNYLSQIRAQIAEQEAKAASKRSFDAFARQYSVAAWPDQRALSANPFVYKDKVVGLYVDFESMITVDRGIFRLASGYMLVSNIPNAAFTIPGRAILAARVFGTEQIKRPLVGDTLVPHLKFVGAHICTQQRCGELLQWNQ
jgi:hypothetical protein